MDYKDLKEGEKLVTYRDGKQEIYKGDIYLQTVRESDAVRLAQQRAKEVANAPKPVCQERVVHIGSGSFVSRRPCGNYALSGMQYCYQHAKQRGLVKPKAPRLTR